MQTTGIHNSPSLCKYSYHWPKMVASRVCAGEKMKPVFDTFLYVSTKQQNLIRNKDQLKETTKNSNSREGSAGIYAWL